MKFRIPETKYTREIYVEVKNGLWLLIVSGGPPESHYFPLDRATVPICSYFGWTRWFT